jgi:rhomboid protease GluP
MSESPQAPLPSLGEIQAFSRRQAMDWSLVLASQGIEAIIERSPERERWLLLVRPEELQRAQDSIRQYRVENRGWSWRQELPGADLELHWGAIVFCVILALAHSLATYQLPSLREHGVMDSIQVHAGQWWRLFTAIFLHDDLAHLAANVTFGILVLGLSMARFGAGLTLISTLFAGAAGNLAGLALRHDAYTGLGASGMMMGALGMLAIHSTSLFRTSPKAARYILSGVSAGLLIFVLFGANPHSDVLAHLGGFLAGLLSGGILALAPNKLVRNKIIDRLALIVFVTFSALVWMLALR